MQACVYEVVHYKRGSFGVLDNLMILPCFSKLKNEILTTKNCSFMK